MAVTTDFSDFTRLAADIGAIDPASADTFRQAVEVTSRRVKDGWNGGLYRDGHARRTGGSVSYDITAGRAGVEGEIGPYVTRAQSGIVKLLETGSVNNPAHGYGSAALHANEGDFEYGVQKAVDDAFTRAGL